MVSGDGDSGPQADDAPGASRGSTASADARARALRETYRQQALKNIGGWSGALIAAIPTAVFIVVNALTALRIAIIAAVAAAALLTGYRLARRQPIQQAVSGLLGVVVAALIAARTGQARGYFLLGIITSFVYAVPFLVSIPLRRPLVGVAWEFLDPTPGTAGARRDDDTDDSGDDSGDDRSTVGPATLPPWHRVRPLLIAYQWTTVVATAVFLLRGFVQLFLYDRNATGWLAAARIAMGYPLFLVAIGVGLLLVRRARRDVMPTATSPTAAARPSDAQDGANPADVSSARREDGVA